MFLGVPAGAWLFFGGLLFVAIWICVRECQWEKYEREFMDNHMASQGYTKLGNGQWRDKDGDVWTDV